MARVVRRTEPQISVLIDMHNDLKDYVVAQLRNLRADMVSIASDDVAYSTPALVDPGPHNDVSENLVTAADGDDDVALAVALVNDLTGLYKFHMADLLAHKDLGDDLESYAMIGLGDGSGDALDDALDAAILQANAISTAYALHIADTDLHYTADGTNIVTESAATDQGSLDDVINELKAILNAHVAAGVTAKSNRAVTA